MNRFGIPERTPPASPTRNELAPKGPARDGLRSSFPASISQRSRRHRGPGFQVPSAEHRRSAMGGASGCAWLGLGGGRIWSRPGRVGEMRTWIVYDCLFCVFPLVFPLFFFSFFFAPFFSGSRCVVPAVVNARWQARSLVACLIYLNPEKTKGHFKGPFFGAVSK